MKVLLAKSAGFCYGVKRAVELAAKTGEETGGCWMLGDLIHNSHVVEDLARRGVRKTEDPAGLAAGDTVRLSFPRDAFEDADMEILRIGPGEGGRSLLVLGCGSRLGDVTLLRRQACTLTFRSYAGLRVPKEALCTGADGTVGVYVREGAVARFKAVDVLYESEDGYVAALDQTSTENLWPGDEILIGSNYYDGKVVSES